MGANATNAEIVKLHVVEEIDVLSDANLKMGGTAITATASEINQHCDESANVETVTTTNVITAAESGKTFILNSATAAADEGSINLVADKFINGDYIEVFNDGVAWHVSGMVVTSGGCTFTT